MLFKPCTSILLKIRPPPAARNQSQIAKSSALIGLCSAAFALKPIDAKISAHPPQSERVSMRVPQHHGLRHPPRQDHKTPQPLPQLVKQCLSVYRLRPRLDWRQVQSFKRLIAHLLIISARTGARTFVPSPSVLTTVLLQ